MTDATAGLGSRVRRGALWSAGSTILMRLANVALMAVVARIVVPEHVGVFALAMAAHAFVASAAELGVASAVARSDLDPERIAPTVTTISIVASTALAGLMALFAEPLAVALGSPDVAGPLRILSLAVALVGPFAVPGAQLQREFRQSRVFLANVVSFVPSSAVLVVLALHGDGAEAFAWSRVVGQLAAGLVVVASVSRLYRPGFALREVRGLLVFGLPLAAANLLSQVVVNVDYVLLGRTLDVAAVGVYMLAFNVASWATAAIGSMLNGVVLPAFSRARQDPERLPGAVARATRAVTTVALLVCAMTSALAGPLVQVLYGGQWSQAAPVLAVLSLYGAVSVVCLLFANVTIAMGRTGSLLGVQAAALVALVPAMVAGIAWAGIVGAGLAHVVVAAVVTLPVYLRTVRRTTGTSLRRLGGAVLPPLVAAVLAWVAAHLAAGVPAHDVVRLLLGGCAGAAVYGILMARDLLDAVGAHRLPATLGTALDRTEPLRGWLVGRPAAAPAVPDPAPTVPDLAATAPAPTVPDPAPRPQETPLAAAAVHPEVSR
ncbi:oligosaccharide flippase family protein [Cellulomonas sp.]|uniref:oligosaccharide flippase family protein n=1 Tax=Cellulomonas sp. TaxID=40001 RepID=UPI0028123D7E|nr:oligosaccharide flippase family protein [Cellulomonas sp.]